MAKREEKRNLETIPVGSLGIIPLEGCQALCEKVDYYLVKWRTERESEHKDSLAFAGYQRDSYILGAKVPSSLSLLVPLITAFLFIDFFIHPYIRPGKFAYCIIARYPGKNPVGITVA